MKILLIPNIKNWALHHLCLDIQQYSRHSCDIAFPNDLPPLSRYDVVYPSFFRLFAELPRDETVTMVTSIHDHSDVVISPLDRRFIVDTKWWSLLQEVDRLSVVSHFLAEVMFDHSLSVYYTPCTTDLDIFRPLEPLSSSKDLRVGWVGTRTKLRKRFDCLAVPSTELPGINFHPQTAEDGHRIFSREGMNLYYNSIDVLLITSTTEGFSLAALEAMAAGRPVVTTFVGGQSQIVLDGVTGFVVEPRISSIKHALSRLCEDRDLLCSMGRAARDYLERFHNWNCVIEYWDAFFEGSPLDPVPLA